MPSQVVPIEGIDKIGFISDTPAVNLPPGAWSDVNNVRFNDGAIRKFKGHTSIFDGVTTEAAEASGESPALIAAGLTDIQHIAYWENPNRRYYIVINRSGLNDVVYTLQLEDDGTSTLRQRFMTTAPVDTQRDVWQSVQFNGGFSIVINNGLRAPYHITAQTGTDLDVEEVPATDTTALVPAIIAQFQILPNWESYIIPQPNRPTGDTTTNATVTSVNAQIIIAEGNVLLAGGLVEVSQTITGEEGSQVIETFTRNLNSVVRVSDVAPAGTIPQNWNPFDSSGTADEIVIADTGLITAMRPLRGQIMVYTSDTITALRITPQGLRASVVTKEYGGLSQSAVFEFKGSHLVIGSDDIYLFSGNPGDIKSVADGRVRNYFYDNLHANYSDDIQIIRDQAFDELWICFANLDSFDGSYNEALIWNYADDVWTKRDLPSIRSLTTGPVPGVGAARTLITVPNGDTGTLGVSTAATATVSVSSPVTIPFTGGVQDVQTINFTGTKNNDFTALSDAFFLRLPNNFSTGTTSSWDFDPDENNAVFNTMVDTTTFTAGLNTTQALAEMSTAMVALTGTGGEVITTSVLPADVTNVADVVGNITFQLDNGVGPVGAFDSLVYAGQNFNLGDRVIETGVDLVNNEGMVFVVGRTNRADTFVYDTINGANMRFKIDEGNNAIVMQNDALDAFRTDGWLLDAGSGQVDGLNAESQEYLSWTMQSGEDFFDVVEYEGRAGVYGTGIDSEEKATNAENGRGWTVIAAGATIAANQAYAGRITLMCTGAGGGQRNPSGGGNGAAGGGGATAWITFMAEVGDQIQYIGGTPGTSGTSPTPLATGGTAGQRLGDSVFNIVRGAEQIELCRAGGGRAGGTSGSGALGGNRNFAGDDTTRTVGAEERRVNVDRATNGEITVGAETIIVISEGGGVGGNGGSAGSGVNPQGGGGGAGGYSGAGGNGADVNFVSSSANLIANATPATAGQGGGGGGGGANGSEQGGYGGGIGIYGEGANGAPGPIDPNFNVGNLAGGGGSGGVMGTASTAGNGNNIGGGSGSPSMGGYGGFRLLSGSTTATYPTTGVLNELVHNEPHNLTSAPGMMWVKARDSAQVWTVWHRDLALEPNQNNDSYIQLSGQNQTTGGDGSNFANTRPTATDFFVGNAAGGGDGRTNGPNATYYNYLFGSDELTTSDHPLLNGNDPDPNGNIYCGSYTNGTAVPGGSIGGIGFFVELGWKPSVMLTKNTGDSQPWNIHFSDPGGFDDTATFGSRFGYPHTSTPWAPLLRFVDVGEFDGVGGTATVAGFSVRSTSDEVNPGGFEDSVIFMAIREPQGPAALPGLVSDEPIFTGTGANGLVVDTGVDFRSGGLTFFGAGGTGAVTPNVLNNFGRRNTGTGPAGARGNQERLPAFNTHLVQRGPVNAVNVFATFQETGLTLTSNTNINTSGRILQPFSFANAPEFMDSKTYTSTSSGGTTIRNVVTHSLGTAPQMVMIKNLTTGESRSNASNDYAWTIWHRTTGNNIALSTNFNPTSGGEIFTNWLDPTADDISLSRGVFRVWTGGAFDSFATYFFGGKDVDGVASNVVTADDGTLAAGGSITGGTGEVVNLGWRPGFIMIKAVSAGSGVENNFRYWSQEDEFAAARNWNNSDDRAVNATLTVTDNGFSADFTAGAACIYWCSRDSIPNPTALPDFDLYNLDGTAVELSEAGRTAIASGRGNEQAFADAVSAVDNHTATVSGNDVIITQDAWAGASNQTHEIVNSDATFISVVDNTANARTQANPSYRSGAVGYQEMLVNLGTDQELDSEVTIVQGNGGVGTQIFADVDDHDTFGPPVGTSSIYTIQAPQGVSQMFTANGDVMSTIVETINHISTLTDDIPDYTATAGDDGTSVVLSAATREAVPLSWVISTTHTSVGDGTDGDIEATIARTTPGITDVYGTTEISISVPIIPSGTTTVPTTLAVASGTAFSTTGVAPVATTLDITADQVATALRATAYSGYTVSGADEDVMFVGLTGRTEDDFSTDGFEKTLIQTSGTGDDVAATLQIAVANLVGADLGPINLNGNETSAEIRQRIIDHLSPFGEFSMVREVANQVEVTHNQFGENRAVISVVYIPSMDIQRDGSFIIDPMDTIESQGGITVLPFEADPERPWSNGVLNEARTFVVTGGNTDIFAMDLGSMFGEADITAFVERRNFQLEPLVDTEVLSGFYMHTDSATPLTAVPLDIKLQGVNTSTTPVSLDLPVGDPQRYIFNIGGEDGDYKIDTRINARLLNYRISETGSVEWEIQSFGVAVDKGGTR